MSNGPYTRGNPINLVQRFWVINPLTGDAVLTDPTGVIFTITDPDGAVTAYEFGVDLNVTNPVPGIFVCGLDPLLPVGIYHYYATGSGAVEAQSPEETFEILENEATTPEPPDVAVMGPCTQWISGEDVAACARVDYDNLPFVFDSVAFSASQAFYEISGRRFPGICTRTVRPAADTCGCWGASSGFGPWYWNSAGWGIGAGWYNERGVRLGCKPMSRVRLAGYPIRQILEVKIDGTVIPEFNALTAAREWRLDDRRLLTRMDKPAAAGVPAAPQFWPACQNMSLDADQPGTFEVKYRWGLDVPKLGRDAAVEIANQLYLGCTDTGDCVLPAGVTKVVRQGIEIERGLLANWLKADKPTGLVSTDLFLQAYCDGQRGGRRNAVWSPDRQQFARKLGT